MARDVGLWTADVSRLVPSVRQPSELRAWHSRPHPVNSNASSVFGARGDFWPFRSPDMQNARLTLLSCAKPNVQKDYHGYRF